MTTFDPAALRLTNLQTGHTAAELSEPLRGHILIVTGMLSGNAPEMISRYKLWIEGIERSLGTLLHRPTVASWCYDQMYWRITERATINGDQTATFDMLRRDLDRREAVLVGLQGDATNAAHRWEGRGDIVVLDTSMVRAVLGRPDNPWTLADVPWNAAMNSREAVRLVLPLAVLSELDRTKRPSNKNPAEAQAVIKWIDRNIQSVDQPKVLRGGSVMIGAYELSIEFYIEPFEASTDDTDLSIIQSAAALQKLTSSRVILGTRDTSMRWRAEAAGVTSVKFPFAPVAQS